MLVGMPNRGNTCAYDTWMVCMAVGAYNCLYPAVKCTPDLAERYGPGSLTHDLHELSMALTTPATRRNQTAVDKLELVQNTLHAKLKQFAKPWNEEGYNSIANISTDLSSESTAWFCRFKGLLPTDERYPSYWLSYNSAYDVYKANNDHMPSLKTIFMSSKVKKRFNQLLSSHTGVFMATVQKPDSFNGFFIREACVDPTVVKPGIGGR